MLDYNTPLGRLKARLDADIETLIPILFPNAKREGKGYVMGDVYGSPGKSLKITTVGKYAGYWKDFATGESGDLIDLLVISQGKTILQLIKEFGYTDSPIVSSNKAKTPKTDMERDCGLPKNKPKPGQIGKAKAIWAETHSLVGSTAMAYLKHRRLVGNMDKLPNALQYHPKLWHSDGETHPAMVAEVTHWTGQFQGIHRTYLQSDGCGKANVTPAKMCLGPIAGGSVHLGAAAQTMGVCEGIETGLAAQQLYDEPVWACLSTAGMVNIQLPPLPMAETVFIYVDNDANHAGLIAGQKLAQRLHFEGRTPNFMMPDQVGWDYADVLYHQLTGESAND
jgi:hypothetical protein